VLYELIDSGVKHIRLNHTITHKLWPAHSLGTVSTIRGTINAKIENQRNSPAARAALARVRDP